MGPRNGQGEKSGVGVTIVPGIALRFAVYYLGREDGPGVIVNTDGEISRGDFDKGQKHGNWVTITGNGRKMTHVWVKGTFK